MNKCFCFMILAFLSSTFSFAQTYQYVPMPTSGMEWKATNIVPIGPGYSDCNKYMFGFTGIDTILNTNQYYKLFVLGERKGSNDCHNNKAFESPIKANYYKEYWYVEQDKKIYILDSLTLDTTKHFPTLDFSVQAVGDTLQSQYHTDTVIAIDTVNINNSLRRRLVIKSAYRFRDTLIEGLGSFRFGLGFKELHEEGVGMSFLPQMVCISANNQLIYQYNNSACAPIWPLDIGEVSFRGENVKVTPNPFTNIVELKNVVNGKLTVYNMFGQEVYKNSRIVNNALSISTVLWQAGVYLFVTEQNNQHTINKLVKY